MEPSSSMQPRSVFRIQRPLCPARLSGATAAVYALLVLCSASPGSAEQSHDGAALFQKHCLSCHKRSLKAGTFESLLRDTRTPPVGMPAFDEQKLTDKEVLAITEHLFPAAQRERDGSSPMAEETGASVVDDAGTGPRAHETEARNAPGAPSEVRRRTLKERKAWMRGFGTH